MIGPHAHVRDSRIGPRTLGLGQRHRVVDRGRGRADRSRSRTCAPGPDMGARCRIGNFAEIKTAARGRRHAAASLQLPRRRGDRRRREHRRRIGDRQLRWRRQAPHRASGTEPSSASIRCSSRRSPSARERRPAPAPVVTRDVAPGKTVVGVPARPIELGGDGSTRPPAEAGEPGSPAGAASHRARIGTRREAEQHRPMDGSSTTGNPVFDLVVVLIAHPRRRLLRRLRDRPHHGQASPAAAARRRRRRRGPTAQRLVEDPSRFLATIQIAITFLGFLAGAVGASAFSSHLADLIALIPLDVAQDAADTIAFVIVTLLIALAVDHRRRAGARRRWR